MTDQLTDCRSADAGPWRVPEGTATALFTYLGIDPKEAELSARRTELFHTPPQAPVVWLEDLQADYRADIETLMDAKSAIDAVEAAVANYRSRPRRPRPAALAKRLSGAAEGAATARAFLTSRDHEVIRVLLKREGVEVARIESDLAALTKALRGLRDRVKAVAPSKKREPDHARHVFVTRLALAFDHFSRWEDRSKRATNKRSFVALVLKAAGVPVPSDLARWYPRRRPARIL